MSVRYAFLWWITIFQTFGIDGSEPAKLSLKWEGNPEAIEEASIYWWDEDGKHHQPWGTLIQVQPPFPRKIRVAVSKNDHALFEEQWVTCLPGMDAQVSFGLSNKGNLRRSVQGKVLRSDGSPLTGGWVRTASNWIKLGSGGEFVLESSGGTFLSPEGSSFAYPLSPGTYEITLPAIREWVHGKLVDPHGAPTAGQGIQSSFGIIPWGFPEHDLPPSTYLTDALGLYQVPLYAGGANACRWIGHPHRTTFTASPGATDVVVREAPSTTAEKPSATHEAIDWESYRRYRLTLKPSLNGKDIEGFIHHGIQGAPYHYWSVEGHYCILAPESQQSLSIRGFAPLLKARVFQIPLTLPGVQQHQLEFDASDQLTESKSQALRSPHLASRLPTENRRTASEGVTVNVLFPPSLIVRESVEVWTYRSDKGDRDSATLTPSQTEPNTYTSVPLRPATYRLNHKPWKAMLEIPPDLEIKEKAPKGEVITFDLRDYPLKPAAPRLPFVSVPLNLSYNSRPVPGAIVMCNYRYYTSDREGRVQLEGPSQDSMVAARLPGKAVGWKRFQMSPETASTGITLDLLPTKALSVSLVDHHNAPGCVITPLEWSPKEAHLIETLLNPRARISTGLRPSISPVAGGLRFFVDQRGELLAEDLPVGFLYKVSLPHQLGSRQISLTENDPDVVPLEW